MGMAASQARLLSITARMSDNEQSGQALAYAKERLADRSDQITKEYNLALSATKLQVMTGYSDGNASYTDISFAAITSEQVVSSLGKQYVVTDKSGKALVQYNVAQAFKNSNGNLNKFLGILGYSLSDINPNTKSTAKDPETEAKIHEAWDRYFNSIGKSFGDIVNVDKDDEGETNKTIVENHLWEFNYFDNSANIGDGYAVITVTGTGTKEEPINYEGTCQEQLDLYNYAMSITESYYSPSHDFTTVDSKYDMNNSSMISYYTNLYNKMLTSGYYTYTSTPAEANADSEHFVYDRDLYKGATSATTKGTPLDDPNTFEQYLKKGELFIETFSKTAGRFVSTSISEDNCIQEVEDKTAIAIAEAEYTEGLAQIERLDSRYDLQMKQLDTEHNTLQTEYESVKNVITKNVEKSFHTFG